MSYPNGPSTAESSKKSSSANAINATKGDLKGLTSKVEKVADEAVEKGSSLADAVISSVTSSVASFLPVKSTEEAMQMLQSTVDDVQSGAVSARDSAESFIRKYPFYSLLGAGFLGAAAVIWLSPRKSKSAKPDLH